MILQESVAQFHVISGAYQHFGPEEEPEVLVVGIVKVFGERGLVLAPHAAQGLSSQPCAFGHLGLLLKGRLTLKVQSEGRLLPLALLGLVSHTGLLICAETMGAEHFSWLKNTEAGLFIFGSEENKLSPLSDTGWRPTVISTGD